VPDIQQMYLRFESSVVRRETAKQLAGVAMNSSKLSLKQEQAKTAFSDPRDFLKPTSNSKFFLQYQWARKRVLGIKFYSFSF
jgi:hypothetical protein